MEQDSMVGESGELGPFQGGGGPGDIETNQINKESYSGELGQFELANADVLSTIYGTTFGAGRMYFSDVVACRDEGEAEELCAELVRRGEGYRGEFILIAIHGDHVHTIHDCAYSNRYG